MPARKQDILLRTSGEQVARGIHVGMDMVRTPETTERGLVPSVAPIHAVKIGLERRNDHYLLDLNRAQAKALERFLGLHHEDDNAALAVLRREVQPEESAPGPGPSVGTA